MSSDYLDQTHATRGLSNNDIVSMTRKKEYPHFAGDLDPLPMKTTSKNHMLDLEVLRESSRKCSLPTSAPRLGASCSGRC